jgi:hypothetical protein
VVARLVANAGSARNVLTGCTATGGTDARVLAGGESRTSSRAVVANATLKTTSAAANGRRAHGPLGNNSSPLLVVGVQRRSRSVAVVAGSVVAAQDAAGAGVSVVRVAAREDAAGAARVSVAAGQNATRRARVVVVAAGQDAAGAGVSVVRVAARENAAGAARVRVAAGQNAASGARVVVVAARQNTASGARVRVAARQNAASGARVVVVATRKNAAGGARVRVAPRQNAAGGARVRVAARQNTASRAAVSVVATRQNTTASVAAATQDTTRAAGVRLVGAVTAQNPTARVVSVAAAVATQNATCGRRVRRIVVGSDGGAESRLGRGVRGFVGGGAVVPSEADVAEDRGDYATFFVGCVVVSCVVEGVIVAAAAGEGVGRRHGLFLVFLESVVVL